MACSLDASGVCITNDIPNRDSSAERGIAMCDEGRTSSFDYPHSEDIRRESGETVLPK